MVKSGKKALLLLLLIICSGVKGQDLSDKYASKMSIPRGYVCYRAGEPILIDGIDDENSWKKATETEAFVDISGYNSPVPRYRTSAKMLWDDKYLYIFAKLEEPDVWANLRKHDEIVFHDNDFEVFLDPRGEGHNYFEIETNALGTIFDLALEKPYRAPHRTFVQFQWNCPGLKLATHWDGKINDPNGKDKGWSVEMAIPREAIASEFDNYLKAGSWLRINFSRVEWKYQLGKNGKYERKRDSGGNILPEDNWVWTPTGKIDMHMPERWGYLYLSDKKVGDNTENFKYPDSMPVFRFLSLLFYAQEEQYKNNRSYFGTIDEFHLGQKDRQLLPKGYKISVESTSHTYEITAISPAGDEYVVDESGLYFKR